MDKHTKGEVGLFKFSGLFDSEIITRVDERTANKKRGAALWNAADGMTTEEAVRYLTHGPEMVEFIKFMVDRIEGQNREAAHLWYAKLITEKMEGK